MLAATPVLGWLPNKVSGPGFIADNRQRVAAALFEYKQGKISPSEYLCAVVGISNVREGINLHTLSSNVGKTWRMIGLAGAGAGVWSIQENADALLESQLDPDLVVLGLIPMEVLNSLLPVQEGGLPPTSPAGLDRLRSALKNGIWIHERRKDIDLTTQEALQATRDKILSVFGVDRASLDPRSPWREMIRDLGAEHYSDAALRQGLVWASSLGAFDKSAYLTSTKSWSILDKIVKSFQVRGARVIVVLMPEHSWLREREPKGMVELFQQELSGSNPDSNIKLFDYRAAIDDDGFVDLVHLNTTGSMQFSAVLADQFRSIRFARAPLMSVPDRPRGSQ